MKKVLAIVMATTVLATACSSGQSAAPAAPETEPEVKEETVTESGPVVEGEKEETTSEEDDLIAFADSIAEMFTENYGFDAVGEYSEADGIVITITAEGSSEWLDHAWDEMLDSVNESYNESKSTMERAGTGDTSVTYLVCDTDGVSYLRYVDGEVEDLASGDRQSVQD